MSMRGLEMSVSRKSCDACFKGRRKCDRTRPVCKRCQRTGKHCNYVSNALFGYDGPVDVIEALDSTLTEEVLPTKDIFQSFHWTIPFETGLPNTTLNFQPEDVDLQQNCSLVVPNLVGDLGELQAEPYASETWTWVTEQLKNCPCSFGKYAETFFIHKSLYTDYLPRSIRAALGVCAARVSMTEANDTVLFRMLNAEVLELLQPATNSSLLDDLAKVQAMALYQIMRLLNGDTTQRTIAEQQANLLKAWSLQLLQRADAELPDPQPTWEEWLLAESVRRVAIVVFLLHGVNTMLEYGRCLEIPTLANLSVSSKADLWHSKSLYLEHVNETETMKYADFTSLWVESCSRKLEPFEKLLVVACKGIEQVKARGCPV